MEPAAKVAGLFGLDVSHWQGQVDWKLVKDAGVQFVYVKATEGIGYVDSWYDRHIAGAKAAGLPCGSYHFFQPTESVAKQVENFVHRVGPLKVGDLPPVLDVEMPPDWSGINVSERVKGVSDWLVAVEQQLGVTPIIYMSPSFAGDELGHPAFLKKYQLWVAHYTLATAPTVPAPFTSWLFWQYSETTAVPGVQGHADVNWFNGTLDDLRQLMIKGAANQTLTERIASSMQALFNRVFK